MAAKVTMKEFVDRLSEYANAGAARKAIGRFNGWSEEEKNRARALVDKSFGVDAKKYAKPARKQQAKRVAKAPVVQAKRRGRPPKSAQVAKAVVDVPTVSVANDPMMPGLQVDACEEMPPRFAAERVIQCAGSVIKTLEMVHGIDPNMCLTTQLEHLANNVTNAICLLGKCLPMGIKQDSVPAGQPARRGRPPKSASQSLEHPRTNGSAALDMSLEEAHPPMLSEV